MTFAFPWAPDLHGVQSGTMTFPAFPFLPMWMCAAVALPVSPLKVSFHVSVFDLPFSTTVPVKLPVPLDLFFGVSCEPIILALTL